MPCMNIKECRFCCRLVCSMQQQYTHNYYYYWATNAIKCIIHYYSPSYSVGAFFNIAYSPSVYIQFLVLQFERVHVLIFALFFIIIDHIFSDLTNRVE